MPTTVTHAFVPIVIGRIVTSAKMPWRFWAGLGVCAIIPDIDVFTALFGVRHGEFLAHRGFAHSFVFAVFVSLLIAVLLFGKTERFSKKWWLMWGAFFAATVSHNFLDMFTGDALGVALLSPFDMTHYSSPFRPLASSPIGIKGVLMFTAGRDVWVAESLWLWLPLIAILAVVEIYRKRKKQVLKLKATE